MTSKTRTSESSLLKDEWNLNLSNNPEDFDFGEWRKISIHSWSDIHAHEALMLMIKENWKSEQTTRKLFGVLWRNGSRRVSFHPQLVAHQQYCSMATTAGWSAVSNPPENRSMRSQWAVAGPNNLVFYTWPRDGERSQICHVPTVLNWNEKNAWLP